MWQRDKVGHTQVNRRHGGNRERFQEAVTFNLSFANIIWPLSGWEGRDNAVCEDPGRRALHITGKHVQDLERCLEVQETIGSSEWLDYRVKLAVVSSCRVLYILEKSGFQLQTTEEQLWVLIKAMT